MPAVPQVMVDLILRADQGPDKGAADCRKLMWEMLIGVCDAVPDVGDANWSKICC